MKKFIILAGSPNTGKTCTTTLVINKLIEQGYTASIRYNDESQDKFWNRLNKKKEPEKSGSVELVNNEKKIYIITYGDKESWLEFIFNKIKKEEYFVVICCSHATKGKKVFNFFHKYIKEIDLNKTQVIPIFKNLLSNHNNDKQENEQMANFIISLL